MHWEDGPQDRGRRKRDGSGSFSPAFPAAIAPFVERPSLQPAVNNFSSQLDPMSPQRPRSHIQTASCVPKPTPLKVSGSLEDSHVENVFI